MTTTPATSALAEALHENVGAQHWISHETGLDGDDIEVMNCEGGPADHLDDAAAILAALPDHILVKREDWERLTRIEAGVLPIAAQMVRLEGGCERGHRRGMWHMHEDVYHARGARLASLVTYRPTRAALAPQPDAAQEPRQPTTGGVERKPDYDHPANFPPQPFCSVCGVPIAEHPDTDACALAQEAAPAWEPKP